jgi:coenzyme Q-binding protein COQ10
MQKYSRRLRLPYTAEQLFELVLDVERYPEFVPGWHAVQIRERDDDSLSVEQTIGFGPLTWRFTSRATFEHPTRITIESTELPFRRLVLDWGFQPAPDGCVVALDITCAFRASGLDRLSKTMTPTMSDGIITAFERRAHQQLGRGRALDEN